MAASAVTTSPTSTAPASVDPRGLRFAAGLTSVVLAVVLVTGSGVLLAVQTVVFAAAAFLGLRYSAYGAIFKRFVRPRLGPPAELEAAAPPRFAQAVGFTFAVIGTVGFLAGIPVLGYVATGFALVAALLNATVGLCLGCEMYLTYKRIITSRTTNQGAIA
jgi:hypothetical protein